MADKTSERGAGATVTHEEYKALGLEITMTRTIIKQYGTCCKAPPAPYPRQARDEKVRVEYCCCSAIVDRATTVAEQAGMP